MYDEIVCYVNIKNVSKSDDEADHACRWSLKKPWWPLCQDKENR